MRAPVFYPTIVISIAAVSGGGKTTITKQLKERLNKSIVLSFDDYDFDGPKNIIDWVDKGANYNEWDLSPLIADLEKLFMEQYESILLDYPFAYEQSNMSKYIDIAIFIDTPLDVAMVRRMSRDFQGSPSHTILQEMENYLSFGRKGYLEMLKTIKPSSDLIVDGTMSIEHIVETILEKVPTYKKESV
ncbi:hypothetical protein [Sutcliffiella sp. NC1]|uniref:hypothetical protein n=1 Tax=Sutcliffiella sp. NC1 TaxID=3004096 RepID=UPI0022DE4BA5|nr:hypothetical protein [Sutcliffiella sp. NC1]WBL13128.1 hypothetical protein O1A01_14410 [Sutcliffiella sp. NC1]